MQLSSTLHQYFGFTSFRVGQEEAVLSLLDHQNTLAIMPTGAGKSLIFQFAALHLKGLTLVISPLIALMKDQVDTLNRRGISATYINSALPVSEQNKRISLLSRGNYKLVYIAPERLRNVSFLQSLSKQDLSLLAVDEAHCISEWGHDFRPDYLYIAEARRKFGNPLTAALTATATPKVQNDIIQLLAMPASTKRIVTGFNRPNLALEVKYTPTTEAKFRALLELLNPLPKGATLIYTGTRRTAEEVAEFIRDVCKVKAEHYHAGLSADDRSQIQEQFINGTLPVIVATNAFGMGIDRADVRQVIHYTLPGSLEAYYQEAGRAGRDGLPAKAVLLYDSEDRALHEYFIANSVVSPAELQCIYRVFGNDGDEIWITSDELSNRTGLEQVKIKVGISNLERVGILKHLGDDGIRMLIQKEHWDPTAAQQAAQRSKQHTDHRKDQLSRVVTYAETNLCRRRIILKHFGDNGSANAPICCDNCEGKKPKAGLSIPQPEIQNDRDAAQVILCAIQHMKINIGRKKLAKVLHGSTSADIVNSHYDKNSYYGRLEAISLEEIESTIDHLIETAYLKVIGGEYPILALTPRGESAIKQKEKIAPEPSKLPITIETKVNQPIIKDISRIVALGESRSPTAVPQLIATLRSQDGNARRLSASALGKIRDCSAVEPLMQLLAREQKPQVRQYAVKALGCIGDPRALNLLTKISEDENEMYYTRSAAESAILECRKAEPLKVASSNLVTNTASSSDLPKSIPSPDPVAAYISAFRPRVINGNWQAGFSLDFHSGYTGPNWNRSAIGDLVYRLKYQADPSVLPALIGFTCQLFAMHPELNTFDTIIPVPSSIPRTFQPVHAFCNALAQTCSKQLQTCVVKTRQTKPQKEMRTLSQKRQNVAGTFALNSDITGKKILLIDDLYDSGATLEEITQLLLRHRAARVNVLTLTRTIHSDE
jgi:ATP-dependent DNA helicase RecQ